MSKIEEVELDAHRSQIVADMKGLVQKYPGYRPEIR
jgi:hypothetical protein